MGNSQRKHMPGEKTKKYEMELFYSEFGEIEKAIRY